MKRYIQATMDPDILSYKQKDELAEQIFSIVRKYFTEDEYSSGPHPIVSYWEYDLLPYTFKIVSRYRNTSATWFARSEGYGAVDLNPFRAEIRKLLKQYGFTKVKFKLDSYTMTTRYWNGPSHDRRKSLEAIYFG